MVDVRGFEPLTPCLQSRLGKTLNAFTGAAYNENHRNSRSSNVPKLYRSIRIRGLMTRTAERSTVESVVLERKQGCCEVPGCSFALRVFGTSPNCLSS